MQAWPILEGNERDYPRGASVNGVLIVMHLSCIRILNGTGAGHRMDHDSNYAKYL